MGWNRGTDIFDTVLETLLEADIPDDVKSDVIHVLCVSLEQQDWDSWQESDYSDHPLVKAVFVELGWDDEDDA